MTETEVAWACWTSRRAAMFALADLRKSGQARTTGEYRSPMKDRNEPVWVAIQGE
jgi:hypothetical protein